jgi:PhzF family phenazine biosynthesis protein
MNSEITLPIWHVDAFSATVFGGNPAAVVALSGPWLPDRLMQAIAAENNLSETAFVRLKEDPVPLRMQPSRPLRFCMKSSDRLRPERQRT